MLYTRGEHPCHACRTWHASTSIRHVSEASETRSSPPSNETVNNLQVAVLSDETRCPFLYFRLLNNPLFNLTLMCFWCHMAANRAVSAALHTPHSGGTLPQGPKIQPLTTIFGWHAEEFCHWFSRFRHASRKRLPAPAIYLVDDDGFFGWQLHKPQQGKMAPKLKKYNSFSE